MVIKEAANRIRMTLNPHPAFAEYSETVCWIDELKPAFGESKFFFEEEMENLYPAKNDTSTAADFE